MDNKKVAIASDHRGVEWKSFLAEILIQEGYEPVDCGPFSEESCDYPDFIFQAAEKLAKGECVRAIGICHSGIGSSIAANKVKGVRAALCLCKETAGLSREHNNANMLILGSGFTEKKDLPELVKTWLLTEFQGGRHERRVDKISRYEGELHE